MYLWVVSTLLFNFIFAIYKKVMIKTVIIPENNILYLTIPNKYVGKEVEVLLYSKDEVIQEKAIPKKKYGRF